jgi:small subunit ribosomal protein S1
VSEIAEERIEDPRQVLSEGQEAKVQIISLDPSERKIGLSIKGAVRAQEMADAQGYTVGANTGGAKLGDVFREKLGDLSGSKSEGKKGKRRREEREASDSD